MTYTMGVHNTDSAESDRAGHSYAYRLIAKGAHREEGNTEYDEVPLDSYNRWLLSSYFEDPVSISSGFGTNPRASDVFYKILAEGGGIRFSDEHPTDFDGDRIFDPTVTIGVSHPQLPVGLNLLEVPLRPSTGNYTPTMVNGVYPQREWEYDVSSFPENEEEAGGVLFDVRMQSDQDPGMYGLSVESSFGYTYSSSCYGCGGTIRTYTETNPIDLFCTFYGTS